MLSDDPQTHPSRATVSPASQGDISFIRSRAQLAQFLGVAERTLIDWERRRGLPVICIGKARYYRTADVESWLLAHRTGSTTAQSAA